MTFTLTQEQYEALIALAREGVVGNAQKQVELDQFLRSIETSNGIERDFVWVQWQEASQPLPPSTVTKFPNTWPPELRRPLELISRKVSRADVDALLDSYANEPHTVLVTRDPAALVGWTTLDDFFLT